MIRTWLKFQVNAAIALKSVMCVLITEQVDIDYRLALGDRD